MIYREPIPLLEAFHFFRAQKFGFSLKDYLDNLIKRHPTHEKEYNEYFVHLFAVYEALAGATVDDERTCFSVRFQQRVAELQIAAAETALRSC